MEKVSVQEEYMMHKFSHSTHASLWVSLTRLDGATTLNTNQICLDLYIRPLVNLSPPLLFIFYTVKYTSEPSCESLVGFK